MSFVAKSALGFVNWKWVISLYVSQVLILYKLDYCNAPHVGQPLKAVQKLQLIWNEAARKKSPCKNPLHQCSNSFFQLLICFCGQFKVLVFLLLLKLAEITILEGSSTPYAPV